MSRLTCCENLLRQMMYGVLLAGSDYDMEDMVKIRCI